jgi:hypothetical protein
MSHKEDAMTQTTSDLDKPIAVSPTDAPMNEPMLIDPHTERPIIYVNGEMKGKNEAMVSVYDHGLLYGDGVFEGIRVYKGKIFKSKQHIDRLYRAPRRSSSRSRQPRGDGPIQRRCIEATSSSTGTSA